MLTAVAPPSPDLLESIRKATPPVRYPRGCFDPLVSATRQLLDNRFTLGQAADFLIEKEAIPKRARRAFMQAMAGRISRLRREAIKTGEPFNWRACMFYDSSHIVQGTGRKAICGAASNAWIPERGESSRCPRCVGVATKHSIPGV